MTTQNNAIATLTAAGLSQKQIELALKFAASTKIPKECACGCGDMTKGGTWIPGHDAKAKSAANGGPRKQARECRCGCSGWTKGGIYKPGHDAKHLSMTLTAIRIASPDEVVTPDGEIITAVA